MPSPNAFALPPSTVCFQLSTVNSRLSCSNSFRITNIRKNPPATPLASTPTRKLTLKSFRINTYKKGGEGEGGRATGVRQEAAWAEGPRALHASPDSSGRTTGHRPQNPDTLPRVMSGASMDNHKRSAGFALTILFAINMMNFFYRHFLAPVVEPIRKEWRLNDTQIVWLSTPFTLFYAILGVRLS